MRKIKASVFIPNTPGIAYQADDFQVFHNQIYLYTKGKLEAIVPVEYTIIEFVEQKI